MWMWVTVKEMPGLVLLISRCTRPVSYLGLPALSVPCGFDGNGLPIAMQLIGRPFAESTLFRLGHACQQTSDWHEQMRSSRRPCQTKVG